MDRGGLVITMRVKAIGGAEILKKRRLLSFFYTESLSCSIGSSGRLKEKVKNMLVENCMKIVPLCMYVCS